MCEDGEQDQEVAEDGHPDDDGEEAACQVDKELNVMTVRG